MIFKRREQRIIDHIDKRFEELNTKYWDLRHAHDRLLAHLNLHEKKTLPEYRFVPLKSDGSGT